MRGGPAAAPEPGVLTTPTILQHVAEQAPPRASQQAPPTDAISGAVASADANPPTSTSCGHGRRGEAGEGAEAATEEERHCLRIREASAPS